jgi:hypothetical protein
MNLEETTAVLAKAASFDNRTVGAVNVMAWHEIIGELDIRDCLRAITLHHSDSTEYLMPAHVRRIAEKVRSERQELEFRDQQHRELEAYRANAGALTDRSEEIQAFVAEVRDVLPEGSVEALHPRREFWRREHQAWMHQVTAEPNPDFDPDKVPIVSWQASKLPPPGEWWENDAEREAHARKLLADAGRLKPRRDHEDTAEETL